MKNKPEKIEGLTGIRMVDTNMYGIPRLSSVYLVAGTKLAIVDTGTSSALERVLEAIKQIGMGEEDVSFVVATHIHPDHAGGAAKLLERLPKARLAVHERGAKHMADPSRLIASIRSARMGENLDDLDDMGPIEKGRILPVKDGDILDLGRRQLRIIAAPGHAPHEIGILDEKSGGLFTGDAMGMFLEGGSLLLPNAVLPDFDLELALASIEKMRSLGPRALLFAHFGLALEVKETFNKVIGTMNRWEAIAMEITSNSGLEKLIQVLEEYGRREIETVRSNQPLYEHLHGHIVPMIAAAYEKHCKQKIGMI